MNTRTIIEYILAALIVLMLGGLSGWYFFLRTQSQTSLSQDEARGYGVEAPLGDAGGNASQLLSPAPESSPAPTNVGFLSRVWNVLTGESAIVPALSTSGSFGGDFGKLLGTDTSVQARTSTAPPPKNRPPQLWHVVSAPVAGIAFSKNSARPVLRYVERSNGYVFEADPETGTVIRMTNTLMPKIYEALVMGSGHVYERSIDGSGDIATFAGSIQVASSTGGGARDAVSPLSGVMLAKNILSLVVNPKSGELFYLTRNEAGTAGFRAQWNGEKPKQVFSSPIVHWRPLWLSDGRIILTQAAADSVSGYSYELKGDGTLVPLLRIIPGLTILPRASSSALVWGRSEDGALTLFTRLSANTSAVEVPLRTIADKCVWSLGTTAVVYCAAPQGVVSRDFLDEWYRGAAHSSDAIWRIDVSAGSSELVYTPDAGAPVDVMDPIIDGSGNYISFINATDRSLWLLRLAP
ncbi:MAG: hypothetical protein Q7S50_02895 [bacterium]|nr:hypothetical protein [bacterium]